MGDCSEITKGDTFLGKTRHPAEHARYSAKAEESSYGQIIPFLSFEEGKIISRREKLQLAFETLRRVGYAGKSVTERFKSEYPALTDIMQEALVEAQTFLEMSDDEFESMFLSSMSYDSFRVLIFYYAEKELRKGNVKKPSIGKTR